MCVCGGGGLSTITMHPAHRMCFMSGALSWLLGISLRIESILSAGGFVYGKCYQLIEHVLHTAIVLHKQSFD